MAGCRWSRPACRWLGMVLAVALAAAGLQAAGTAAALAAVATKEPSSGPVSNAFAMGGGVGGSIDQRTGAFEASLPLVNVAGRAGAGLSLTLSYDQSLAMLGAAGDRFGFGAGWSLGIPWVNTAGGVTVYPASGGSYSYDASTPTGLADYPLRDLTFSKNPGTIPARPGLPNAQNYQYSLTNLGGTVDRFDAQGNLVEQVDRFGNTIGITWRQSGHSWQPTSVVDNYGQVTTFGYSTDQVTVTSPVNAENITAATTLQIDNGLLTSVTDPLNQVTRFQYVPFNSLNADLLSSVISPTGEHTTVTYTQPLPVHQPGLVVASTVQVTDADRNPVQPELHFNIDPLGNQHNYTGYPLYNKDGPNGLFNSGDSGYRYTTELTNEASTVDATYNSLHLLVSQKVTVASPTQGTVLNQAQTYTYPSVTSVANLPPNYSKPTSVTVTYGDPLYGATRTITTSSSYNDEGELVSAANAAGMVTKDSYFPNGLPDTQTETGPDGETSVTTDTLTADGKSIDTVTTAVGATVATATARTVATYDYNSFGQVTGKSQAWAPGAKPPGDSGGPDQIDDTQKINVDTAAHTQTDAVTTAAGTPQAATTSTVTDLVTGEVLSQTNPDNLTTSYTYDALGRQLTRTAPGGLATRTVYNSPTVSTVTAPSGLETQTTTDVLGRTVKVTDNVSGEKLVDDPAVRTLETDSYSPDGTKLATATPAGATTTTFDPLGRPTQIVEPGGITQADSYNEAKNTQTISLLPAHANDPRSVTTDTFSNLNAPTGSSTSYPDGTQQAPTAETYDGLGRVASFTADNVTTTVGYPGAGGLQSETTLTPGDTGAFPGQPVTASTGNTMTGAMTTKTLSQQAATRRPAPARARTAADGSATGSTYTYNPAGQVATATDPAGHTTRYTYTPGGQIATLTTPSGTVTAYTYDSATGRLREKEIRAPDGTSTATGYTYFPDTGLVKSVYDPAHPADAMTYEYDADGHVTAIHYPDGTRTAATYDDNGRLATTTDITGAVTTYTYNADGNCGPAVTDLCTAVQKRYGVIMASIGYTYDSLDRVHTITRGNNVTTTLDYTDANRVRTQTTTAADGSLLRRDDYTYDSHGNIATHTITGAQPAPAAAGRAGRLAAAGGTPATTTAYGYDAYNRLISSTVYPGATATGTPTTATSYTVDVAGDVTGQTTTADGKTSTTVNTIDGGRLTARDVNGVVSHQDFSADGNVTEDLAGNSYTYNLAGQIASVITPAGVTTSYGYWPDGTRRAATTTTGGVDHTITYHYATAGQLADDTYTGGGPAVTASYLMGVNREARTLATTTRTGRTTQASGPGTGYYLTDAHGSVTTLTGDHGQLTDAYAYGDYGQPTGPDTAPLATPAPDPAGNAAVNPFTYDGAYTNPSTGTQYLPARTYDPAQGRFLSLDAADQLNRYQAFNTNPIINTDPTGQDAIPQYLVDGVAAGLFILLGVISLGSGLPVLAGALGAALGAAATTAEVTGAAIAGAVLETVTGLADIAAGATSATLAVDDGQSLTGHGFLSDATRQTLETANFALGIAGGAAEYASAYVDPVIEAEQAAAVATRIDTAYQAGLDVGSTNGLNIGKNLGRAEGNAQGFVQGQTAGYQSGFQSGYWEGLDESAAQSKQLPGLAQNPNAGVPELVASEPLDRVQPMADPVRSITEIAGQDQQLNAATSPFQVAGQVPGSPSPASLPTAGASNPGTSGVTPGTELTGQATTGAQQVLDNNTPTESPEPPANLAQENTPPSVISPSVSGFSSGSGLDQTMLGPPPWL